MGNYNDPMLPCAVDLIQDAKDLELQDAKVEMFKGSMRLSVPESGSVQLATSPLSIKANVSLSLALPVDLSAMYSSLDAPHHLGASSNIIYIIL